MKRIFQFLKLKANLLALMFCGFFCGFWVLLLVKRYYFLYDFGGWDTVFNFQILRNLAHGAGMYISLEGGNFLADHCLFLAFFLAPFYWVWPSVLLLRCIQTGVFFVGAYIFFLILQKKLHPFVALGGMIVFILAPANLSMLRSCFNFETFAIPLVLLVFKTFDENKYKRFLVSCIFLAMVKEQMPLVVMMFGILAFFVKKENKIRWALVPFLMGLTIFIVEVFFLVPYLNKGLPGNQSKYWAWHYMQFGQTPQQILYFLLIHPVAVFKQCFSPENIKWYNDLFSAWGGLSFFSPQILLPALPLFFKTILSRDILEHTVGSLYYASTFTPYIYLAAWNTLNHIQNKWRLFIHTLALALMLIHSVTFIHGGIPSFPTSISTKAMTYQRFFNKIPEHASLVGFVDYYHDWKELYWVHQYEIGRDTFGKKFLLPESVEYLIMDFSNGLLKNDNIKLMQSPDFYDKWRLIESIEDLALFVKNTPPQRSDRLIESGFKLFPVKMIGPRDFDKTIELETIEFPKIFAQKYRILPVTMYWKCLKSTNTIYNIRFNIFSAKGRSYYVKYRPVGSTIYPTNHWREGEYVKESYYYLLPHLPRGKFILKISIYNPKALKWVGANEQDFSVS